MSKEPYAKLRLFWIIALWAFLELGGEQRRCQVVGLCARIRGVSFLVLLSFWSSRLAVLILDGGDVFSV